MLVAAATCPHPPLLVPEVSGRAESDLSAMRAACDTAVRRLVAAEPDLFVVVGHAGGRREFEPGSRGSLRPFGVDVQVVLGARGDSADPAVDGGVLPLSLTLGAWLLGRSGWSGRCAAHGLDGAGDPAGNAALGERIAESSPRVALLAMGDGSARQAIDGWGTGDREARRFDAEVGRALASADTGALVRLEPATARAFGAAGLASWQVLAGAAGGGRFDVTVLYEAAPYAVAYFVTTWIRV